MSEKENLIEPSEAVNAIESPRELQRQFNDRTFDFGTALALTKRGIRVARSGWNGKNMFICYQQGYPDGININRNTAEATGIAEGTLCAFLPYLMMKTADVATTFVPWLISQTDALAEDWRVYEDAK